MSEAGSIDYIGALEAVERILNRGGEPEDVVGAVLEALRARGVAWANVRLTENDRLGDAPAVGDRGGGIVAAVVFEATEIGSLELAAGDPAFVERVAVLISPYVARLETSGDG